MLSIVNQPARGPNCLNKIFVNEMCYDGVKVVNSAVKSDHKAIVAYVGSQPNNINKHTMKRKYRRRTPARHAAFLKHISNVQFAIGSDSDIQANFDKFYEEMHILLDQFYPEREISVTSADPRFVTPIIKSMLRRKNRLMRSGRLMKPMR